MPLRNPYYSTKPRPTPNRRNARPFPFIPRRKSTPNRPAPKPTNRKPVFRTKTKPKRKLSALRQLTPEERLKIARLRLRRLEARELRAESKIKNTATRALLLRKRDKIRYRLNSLFNGRF